MVPGTLLTEEGSPVSNLFYLAEGSADVVSHGSKVATLQERSLIGEMTALSGEPATGTVLLNEPSRCLMIPSDALRNLLQRDGDMRRQIDACFAVQVKEKLLNTNKALSAQQVSNGELPVNAEKAK